MLKTAWETWYSSFLNRGVDITICQEESCKSLCKHSEEYFAFNIEEGNGTETTCTNRVLFFGNPDSICQAPLLRDNSFSSSSLKQISED